MVSEEKNKNDQPSERVNRLVKLAKAKLVSIDTQVNDSDKNTLGDVIPDEKYFGRKKIDTSILPKIYPNASCRKNQCPR